MWAERARLTEKEFRIMIVKLSQDLGKRKEAKIEKTQEMLNKDLEELRNKHLEKLKNKQTEVNNVITEMKNILEGINSRINEAEEQTSELEDNRGNHCCRQIKEKRMKRNEDSLRDLWDNIKCTNIHIIGVPEGEQRQKGPEKISEEIIVKSFLKMGKEIATQVQEVQRVPGRINPRRNMPRQIVIKLTKIKDKEKLLKATREKQQITYKGTPIWLTADFSAETLQARREWHDIFKVMKGKNLQLRLLYPAKISFRFDREAKRIQHHQTSSTTNAKGTSLSGKHKRRKGPTKTNP